jgi:hypothetical protein
MPLAPGSWGTLSGELSNYLTSIYSAHDIYDEVERQGLREIRNSVVIIGREELMSSSTIREWAAGMAQHEYAKKKRKKRKEKKRKEKRKKKKEKRKKKEKILHAVELEYLLTTSGAWTQVYPSHSYTTPTPLHTPAFIPIPMKHSVSLAPLVHLFPPVYAFPLLHAFHSCMHYDSYMAYLLCTIPTHHIPTHYIPTRRVYDPYNVRILGRLSFQAVGSTGKLNSRNLIYIES